MRVLLLTHYYAPERGAPQTRLRETVSLLTTMGIGVSVVTGPPHYPDGRVRAGYSWWRPRRDSVDGVTVWRLPMIPRRNGGMLDRLVDQGSFAAAAMSTVPLAQDADVVLVESPPLFLGATAAAVRLLSGRPYVFHVADPWPDFPIAMGALRGRLPIRAAQWLESVAYRYAALVTTPTPGLVSRIGSKPGASGKVRLLPNGVDLDRFVCTGSRSAIRRRLGWGSERRLVYIGTVGLAQGVGTLVDAMLLLPPDIDLRVVVIGEGAEATELSEKARRLGIDRLTFMPPVDSSDVPALLHAADAALTMLRRGPLYEEALPTKLLEAMAAGKPIVLSADGYSASLVSTGKAGVIAAPEDPAALVEALRRIASSDDLAMMGDNARRAAAPFDRRLIAANLRTYLQEASARASG